MKTATPFLLLILSLLSITAKGQNSPKAKSLLAQAIVDSLAKDDSLGAIHFYNAVLEEKKISNPDYNFIASSIISAGSLKYHWGKLNDAEQLFYEGWNAAHKANNNELAFKALERLGRLYDYSVNTNVIFDFHSSSFSCSTNHNACGPKLC